MQGKTLYQVKSRDNRAGGGAQSLNTFDNERSARIALGHYRKEYPDACIIAGYWTWDSVNEDGTANNAVRHEERIA